MTELLNLFFILVFSQTLLAVSFPPLSFTSTSAAPFPYPAEMKKRLASIGMACEQLMPIEVSQGYSQSIAPSSGFKPTMRLAVTATICLLLASVASIGETYAWVSLSVRQMAAPVFLL